MSSLPRLLVFFCLASVHSSPFDRAHSYYNTSTERSSFCSSSFLQKTSASIPEMYLKYVGNCTPVACVMITATSWDPLEWVKQKLQHHTVTLLSWKRFLCKFSLAVLHRLKCSSRPAAQRWTTILKYIRVWAGHWIWTLTTLSALKLYRMMCLRQIDHAENTTSYVGLPEAALRTQMVPPPDPVESPNKRRTSHIWGRSPQSIDFQWRYSEQTDAPPMYLSNITHAQRAIHVSL